MPAPRSKTSARRQWSRPAIAQSAVDAFLRRELPSWSWLKREEPAVVRTLLRDEGVDFCTEPMAHQAACVVAGLEQDSFGFFLDPGTGKSKIALDIVRIRKKRRQLSRTLVLSPSPTNVEGWLEQVATHAHDLSAVPLVGERTVRLDALKQPADLYLLNYAGLPVFCCKHAKKKKELMPVRGLVERFASQFDAVVFDESHLLGNHRSLVFTLCRAIAARAKYRYALTGTPFGRDPQLLWTQFYLLDGGATLGPTLGLFRAAFFTEKENYWGGRDYTFIKRRKFALARMLQNRSLRYEDTECGDLPPMVRVPIHVTLPEDAEALHKRLMAELREAHGNYTAVESAFIRMRQLASGFVTAKGADEERVEVEFDSPKLEALADLLRGLPEGEKVVVFHDFIRTGARIGEMLDGMKIGHARLWGGTRDKPGELNRFLKNQKCRVLVANTKSGGTGLNLQVARRVVFFESPVSPIIRRQAEKRCHRTGQNQHVYVYDLIARGTVDEKILKYVQEGRDLFEAICSAGYETT